MQLYTEPVVGYRVWLADRQEDILTGVIYAKRWEDTSAECRRSTTERPRHGAPNKGCHCGWWAFNTYELLQQSSICGSASHIRSVRGIVVGWGKVVLTEKGWRAEYARPAALLHWPERRTNVQSPFHPADHEALATDWNDRMCRIAERYGIPYLDTIEDLQREAQAVGSPIAA